MGYKELKNRYILLSIVFLSFLEFILIIPSTSYYNNHNTSQITYNSYSNQYMSFQYPSGWKVENNSFGGVYFSNGLENNNSEWLLVVPYGNYDGNVNNMDVYQKIMSGDISSNARPISYGTINGTSYSFVDDPNFGGDKFTDKYCFFVKNGKGVIVSGQVSSIDILKNVVATFN